MPPRAVQQPITVQDIRAALRGAAARSLGTVGAVKLPHYHPGPQTAFRESLADVVLYGGAAGGGKTYALLAEPLKHITEPRFGAVIFRRELTRFTSEGGAWDEALDLYPDFGAVPRQSPRMEFRFPSGAKVQFGHLEHEKSKLSWQGAQIALLLFDQLEEINASQFWFLWSRLRSTSGVHPYIRATFNPAPLGEPGYWVNELVSWWWDPETGLPIPERAGVIRWFLRVEDELDWADSKAELLARHPEAKPVDPQSFTFIPAKLSDNPTLMQRDPGYLGKLRAMPAVDRRRLEEGNFLVSAAGGGVIERSWFPLIADPASAPVADTGKVVGESVYSLQVRAWDLAGTETAAADATCGVKMGRVRETARLVVRDEVYLRKEPGEVLQVVGDTMLADGSGVVVALRIDPAQAGKFQAAFYIEALRKRAAAAGASLPTIVAMPHRSDEGKLDRIRPFVMAAAPAFPGRPSPETGQIIGMIYGTVDVASGPYSRGNSSEHYLDRLHHFTGQRGGQNDTGDATADAFSVLHDPAILTAGAFAWTIKRH